VLLSWTHSRRRQGRRRLTVQPRWSWSGAACVSNGRT